MDGKSLDITATRLEQLQQLFPEVFAEGQVDFEKLKLVLGAANLAPEERYELSWAGKHDAFKEIQKQTTATLIPNKENSINFDSSENIFIEGENLEALRVLQKSYYGKIKMIYIDPPYNTGNDSFVYPDDYTERRSAYEERTGIKDEEGFLNKQDLWKKNTKENGQFHSVWLSMLYPRLFLARNLLKEDGVIFVSIDDNEVTNLRLLMDMVFGEENFVASITTQVNKGGRDYLPIAVSHENLLLYSKRTDVLINEIPKTNNSFRYDDKLGGYNLRELRNRNPRFNSSNRPNLFYPFYVNERTKNENGECLVSLFETKEYDLKVLPLNSKNQESCWRWGKIKVEKNIGDSFDETQVVARQTNSGRWNIYEKHRKETTKAKSIWEEKSMRTEAGTIALGELEMAGVFSHPKPIGLIKKVMQLGMSKNNDLILDFFAGSGTTAHAVLDLNQEDGGNRKFICIQLPEATPANSEAQKAGYETISQISQARIQKVIEKIKEEQAGQLDFNKDTPQDLGFKSFTLAPSNFKVWQSDAQGDALTEQLDIFQNPYKEGAEQENMLYELLLKAGYPLTVAIQKTTIANHVVYHVDGGHLLLALEAINEAILTHVLATQPQRFITLDQLFEQDDPLLTNTRLQLQEAGIDFQVI